MPSHGTPWEYLNYVDIEGGMEEERVQKAVAELNEWSTSVCVLGSYPKFAGGVEVGVGHNGAMSTGIVGG